MAKEKFVRLTRNVLSETFQECNDKYFEGTLPTPEIFELWTPSKNIAGWIRGVWIPKDKNWKTATSQRCSDGRRRILKKSWFMR